MAYRYEATSVAGFVQQIAVSYIRHGYWWYVTGTIPENKDPKSVDAKLLAKYSIAVSDATRWRRKQLGKANLQYIRYGRFFVLMATKGKHDFWSEEEYPQLKDKSYWDRNRSTSRIRDIRYSPLRSNNYSISYRPGGRTRAGKRDAAFHSHVQIDWRHYKSLKDMFANIATRRSADQLASLLYQLPFEAYAPVRRQTASIWKQVNRERRRAGLTELSKECLHLRRMIVKPFD